MICACRYSVAGWSVPAIPVIVAISIDHIDTMSELSPQYGIPECWFNSQYGLFLYFLIPIAVTLAVNAVFYIIIVVKFAMLAYQTRGVRTSHTEKLVLGVKLFFAFGLLWIFGILSAVINKNEALVCIFMFSNSLSGVFLLVIFVCNGAVVRALKQQFGKRTRNNTINKSSGKFKSRLMTVDSNSTSGSFNASHALPSSHH